LIIKGKNGKILQDKEETKQRWTEYCSELYKDTAKEGTVTPPSIDDQGDYIMLELVEKAIKRLKRNKSLGTDGIVGEATQAGGIKLAKVIHKICENVNVKCKRTRQERVVHIINRNTAWRPIVTHYLHNISGERG